MAALPALALVTPVLAQNQPIRVMNNAPLSATGLFLLPTGTTSWGANLLAGQFLPPGAFLSLQLGEGTGCRYDVRLVMRDGRESVRRNVDVCVERVVEMSLDPAAPSTDASVPTPPSASAPTSPAVPRVRP
jgi:hypothetical protein